MNRGQVLYRIAEMIEARSDEFVDLLVSMYGLDDITASTQVADSVDTVVWYAGATGKLAQVHGSVNQVAGRFLNVSVPTPVGVTALLARDSEGLLGLIQSVLPLLATGNTVIVATDKQLSLIAVALSEVLATSDVPAGVVNILTGSVTEVGSWLAAHMDVNAIALGGADPALVTELQKSCAENLKRILPSTASRSPSLKLMLDGVETKTVWYPSGL
jgi:acyl-CoA reductase-like NAD-dependent aldehyde dehydrogenase